MIGPSPNPLILSYLKYAISSQVNSSIYSRQGLKVKGLEYSCQLKFLGEFV